MPVNFRNSPVKSRQTLSKNFQMRWQKATTSIGDMQTGGALPPIASFLPGLVVALCHPRGPQLAILFGSARRVAKNGNKQVFCEESYWHNCCSLIVMKTKRILFFFGCVAGITMFLIGPGCARDSANSLHEPAVAALLASAPTDLKASSARAQYGMDTWDNRYIGLAWKAAHQCVQPFLNDGLDVAASVEETAACDGGGSQHRVVFTGRPHCTGSGPCPFFVILIATVDFGCDDAVISVACL